MKNHKLSRLSFKDDLDSVLKLKCITKESNEKSESIHNYCKTEIAARKAKQGSFGNPTYGMKIFIVLTVYLMTV